MFFENIVLNLKKFELLVSITHCENNISLLLSKCTEVQKVLTLIIYIYTKLLYKIGQDCLDKQ